MTFNEIEKEFDEQFTFTDNWGTFVGWYEQNDGTKGYYTNDKIKSFLKQSFIKYLESQVERHKARIEDLKERQPHHTNDVVDYMQGSIDTLRDEINNLEAQLKELR